MLRKNSGNFPIFLLNIFKLFLKTFGNISRYLEIFSKLSKIIFDIVLTSRTRVCIACHSVPESIGYGYIRYSCILMTPCFAGCIVSLLHPICRYLQTSTKSLSRKKFEFCEIKRKEVYTLFVIDPSFRERV